MKESYEASAEIKGRTQPLDTLPLYLTNLPIENGAHKQRVAIIKAKLTGADNVFKDILSYTAAAFQDCVDEWATEVRDDFGRIFAEVVTDFHSRFNNDEVEDESKKAFREKLLLVAQGAKERINGPLKAEIEECAKYE